MPRVRTVSFLPEKLPAAVRRGAAVLGPAVAAALLAGLAGCGRPAAEAVGAAAAPSGVGAYLPPPLAAVHVGAPVGDKPWIAHVAPADLDGDGLLDLLVCDAKDGRLGWIRQAPRGVFTETTLAEGLRGPVHAEAVDFDGDGDRDVLVASMGVVFPNNDKIGRVLLLENDGAQRFTVRTLLENTARVTDVRAVDLNGDGRLDLAVAQFGYDQGEIRWLENLGGGNFRGTILLERSGAINVVPADFNADGATDLVAIVAQQWEEVVLFTGDGRGNFATKTIFGSTNEDFGSSGLTVADLNRDGRPDVLFSNGDGFDYAEPGPRPWHGVQWLENLGGGEFRFHRIGELAGAYSPVALDFDGDGATDVVAVSGFNAWDSPRATSLALFRNDGRMNFAVHRLAAAPTHLMTAAVGDFDGTGRPAIATGGFHAYPPWDKMSRVSLWRAAGKTPP